MADARKPEFVSFASRSSGVLVLFCEEGLKLGPACRRALAPTGDLLQRAATADRFTGKKGSTLEIVAPSGLAANRLVVLGVGKAPRFKAHDLVKLGGVAVGKVPATASSATIVAELASGSLKPDQSAELALGTQLRSYVFDCYKTKRKEGEEPLVKLQVSIAVASVPAAQKAWRARDAVAEGVIMVRG